MRIPIKKAATYARPYHRTPIVLAEAQNEGTQVVDIVGKHERETLTAAGRCLNVQIVPD